MEFRSTSDIANEMVVLFNLNMHKVFQEESKLFRGA